MGRRALVPTLLVGLATMKRAIEDPGTRVAATATEPMERTPAE